MDGGVPHPTYAPRLRCSLEQCARVVVQFVLDASLHVSVHVWAHQPVVTQEEKVRSHRSVILCLVLHLPFVVLAFLFRQERVQPSISLVDVRVDDFFFP